MAVYVIKNAKLYVAQYDYSGYSSQLRMSVEAGEVEDTNMGDTSRDYLPGLINAAIEQTGYVDLTDNGIDEYYFDSRIGATYVPMTVCPTTGADGETAYTMNAFAFRYNPGAAVGERLNFTLTGRAQGKVPRGTVMATGSKTSSDSGTVRQLGAVTAAQSVYAALHVFSASGTSPTLDVIVRSDNAENMLDPTTKITFTQAIAATSERKSTAGAITDDWWDVSWVIGGSDTPTFNFAVVVAII